MFTPKLRGIGVVSAALCGFFANPAVAQYTLQWEVDPPDSGSVAVSPDTALFEDGDWVTITAVPEVGWDFLGWEGDVASDNNSMTFTISSDANLVARFTEAAGSFYVLTAYVDPSGAGSIGRDPLDLVLAEGTEVSLTAFADEGFAFSGWSGDLPEGADPSDPELTVMMSSNLDIKASYSAAAELEDEPNGPTSGACGALGAGGLGLMVSLSLVVRFARRSRVV